MVDLNESKETNSIYNKTEEFLSSDANLFTAIEKSNLSLVEKLLKSGTNPNITDNLFKQTPLILASQKGDDKMVTLLLEHNAQIDTTDADGDTALLYAIEKSNYNTAKILLSKNANIFIENNKGISALRYMLIQEHLTKDTLEILLLYGLDLNNKECSLVYACVKGDRELVLKLLDEGVNLNTRIAYEPPIMYAIYFGHEHIILLLIQADADLILKKQKRIANWVARIFMTNRNLLKNQEIEKFAKLIRLKCIHNYFKNLKTVQETQKSLIEKKIYTRDENKLTLPILLVLSNDKQILRDILNLNPPVWFINARDEFGYTALMYAIKLNNHECIIDLIKYIKNGIWVKNKYGKTALEYATIYNNLHIFMRILGSNKIRVSSLIKCLNIALRENYQSIITYGILDLVKLYSFNNNLNLQKS